MFSQHKKKVAGYRYEGFISNQMLVGGCIKQVE